VALFESPRAVSEPAAAYLAETAKRLEPIRARSGAGKVAVEFLEIHTSPR
jgi:hypothetical protein